MPPIANALKTLGARTKGGDIFARASISVKLSALHPRYEVKQEARVMAELLPRVAELAAAGQGAECRSHHRCGRGEPAGSLARTVRTPGAGSERLKGWNGLGLAVQAYGKRAKPVLEWLAQLAAADRPAHSGAPGQGRLLGHRDQARAGAGLASYPLFTRKVSTDVSYLACARYLLAIATLLPAVRHPQCPYAGGHLGHGGQ